jgi:hypothetical protein
MMFHRFFERTRVCPHEKALRDSKRNKSSCYGSRVTRVFGKEQGLESLITMLQRPEFCDDHATKSGRPGGEYLFFWQANGGNLMNYDTLEDDDR